MYSYSRTRGLFGGGSLDSVILERSDTNVKAYTASGDYLPEEVSARSILTGQISPPGWANVLVQAIERRVGTLISDTWIDDAPSDVDEDGQRRGYSFGSEFASLGSTANGGRDRRGGTSSPRARLDRLQTSEGDWGDAGNADDREYGSSKTAAGRLRGYSLGSFRKSKSGTSTPTRRAAIGRYRAYSAADPSYRHRDDEAEDFGRDRDRYEDDGEFSRPERSASRLSDDIAPPSPSSTTSSASRARRVTDFMKRPVLPARKSTSAIDRFNDGRTSPTMQRSSPLTGGGGGRTRSGTLASSIGGRGTKSRLERTGRYSSEDEGVDGVDDAVVKGDRASPFADKASPFADRFGEVEHRFSDNEDEPDNPSNRRRGGSASRSRELAVRPSRSGSGSVAASVLSSLSRPKLGSRKSSGTGVAAGAAGAAASAVSATTSVVKGVFKARPGLSKRSATAPNFSRDDGEWDSAAYRRRQRGGFEDDDDADGISYGRLEGGRYDDDLEDILVDSRQQGGRSNDVTDTTDDEQGQIRINRPENPFAEGSSKQRKGDGFFGSARENRNIIASLDEADEADLHLTGSSFESHNLARPTHRLESRTASISGRPRALPLHDDDDASSIRSLDSSKGEATFAGRAVKPSTRVLETEADFLSQLEPGLRFLKTDTRTASSARDSKKEYRVATFDFEGGEGTDLPFKVGDVLEVLSKDDPEWFFARLGMKEGIIPVNRTKPYAP